jgi:hypothetical protein
VRSVSFGRSLSTLLSVTVKLSFGLPTVFCLASSAISTGSDLTNFYTPVRISCMGKIARATAQFRPFRRVCVHGIIHWFASPSCEPFLGRQGTQDVVLYGGIEICWTVWFWCPPGMWSFLKRKLVNVGPVALRQCFSQVHVNFQHLPGCAIKFTPAVVINYHTLLCNDPEECSSQIFTYLDLTLCFFKYILIVLLCSLYTKLSVNILQNFSCDWITQFLEVCK